MNRRMMMFKSVADASRLPSEYQEVEWIGAETEQRQRIATGIVPQGVANVSIRVKRTSGSSNNNTYLFCGLGTNRGTWIGKAWDRNAIGFSPDGGEYFGGTGVDVLCDIDVHFDVQNGTSTATYNNKTIRRTQVGSRSNFTIFGNGTFSSHCRIYYLRYQDDRTEAEFIPCYRKADGVIGMYELKSKTFFTNSGGGSFTKGADVN